MKNILVTGGAGYIGSHTAVELLTQGYDVVCIDNFSNSKKESLNRITELTGRSFPFYEGDVRDTVLLGRIFSENDIDAVIHFAGLKAVGESVSKPIEYYDNNLNSTIALCKAMKAHGVKKIIYSSSATVYGDQFDAPFLESYGTGAATCPYGWTKIMCERILTDCANAEDGFGAVLLRYANPIGAHESGRIGEDPFGIPLNLLPFITQTAVGRRETLEIFGDDYPTPDGTCIRDYIHVSDLAKGHVAAIKFIETLNGAEAINLGTGTGVSVLEMICAFESATGVTLNKRVVGRRDGDSPIGFLSAAKSKSLLGWSAEKTITDACVDSWRWQSENPLGYGDDVE